ncbi:MAG: CotH kinase family protein, partial [Clostridia bacterium]|nr:CotH kinase family protein [Clostridia bacterium]
RNGGNDSPHQARENFLRMDLLRDCIANEYCMALSGRLGVSVFAQRSVPVSVYLNGEYYGMAVMKEDFDERLISERYGLEKDRITVIKGKKLYYQLESGSQAELDSWLELCDYAIAHAAGGSGYASAYEYVSQKIDVDNAAAYLAVMLYLCNTDWPQNNAMVWRFTGNDSGIAPGSGASASFSDGKWRFVIRDMDLCFALHDEPSRVSKTTYSMADTDTFYRLLVFYREGKGYDFDSSLGLYGDDMKLQGLFDFLLRSEEFRGRFARFCDVLCSPEEAGYIKETALLYKNAAKDEIKRHIDLWKSRGEIYAAYSFEHWEKSFDDISEFADERAGYFRKYYDETMKYYD